MMQLLEKAIPIKLIIFDVDGVFTDGTIAYNEQGETLKHFNTQDGLGIKLLLLNNIDVAVITSRQSPIVKNRMDELGVSYIYQGERNKQIPFDNLRKQTNYSLKEIAYVGDDLPDLPLIQQVGLGIAVSNAVHAVRESADYVTQSKGGSGAVREICDLLLHSQDKLKKVVEQFSFDNTQ